MSISEGSTRESQETGRDLAGFFEHRFGATPEVLESVMNLASGSHVDFADLYFEHTVSETMSLEEGIVKKAGSHVSQGAGARIISGEKTGFALTEEIDPKMLRLTMATAREIALHGGDSPARTQVGKMAHSHSLYPVTEEGLVLATDVRRELLSEADRAARAYDHRVKQVMVSLATEVKTVLTVREDGQLSTDLRPLYRFNITVIAQNGTNRQTGSYGFGGRVPFSSIPDIERIRSGAREAARQAVVNLDARDCPSGTMAVVLGPGWPGILLHEAVGHGLEGDFNRKGTSAFSGRIGEKVASSLCTVIDDGTIPGRRGSLNVDDEGTPTSRTVLIEKGILRGYLQDRHNAHLMGMKVTGNGRRESYAHAPMPRMTNTSMLGGDSDPKEILESLDRGIYAVNFGGGQVDITSGKFVFSTSDAYYVEKGRILYPVRGATLIGSGPEVLTKVSMVGSDMALDSGVGTCGKDGQSVPVGVGLPTIMVEELTVGGTA